MLLVIFVSFMIFMFFVLSRRLRVSWVLLRRVPAVPAFMWFSVNRWFYGLVAKGWSVSMLWLVCRSYITIWSSLVSEHYLRLSDAFVFKLHWFLLVNRLFRQGSLFKFRSLILRTSLLLIHAILSSLYKINWAICVLHHNRLIPLLIFYTSLTMRIHFVVRHPLFLISCVSLLYSLLSPILLHQSVSLAVPCLLLLLIDPYSVLSVLRLDIWLLLIRAHSVLIIALCVLCLIMSRTRSLSSWATGFLSNGLSFLVPLSRLLVLLLLRVLVIVVVLNRSLAFLLLKLSH